ncbi:general substrate transporter [Kockovaella imperatae]|uniref:General substrate transporter n=1 Tax=Kockovaella imperatae TaxID=4999 RepID=A0A1Y1UM04_9TREE|nr:general substrate transporter [Kockovaella imperatae]ORX38165.1 general substrate transporter [Kockovaella imperatae]
MEHAGPVDGGTNQYREELNEILKNRDIKWYKGHYLKLNALLFLLVMTSMNNGYDGSMMNGLQTVENWQVFFHHPHGSVLGVFNAIQSIGGIVGLPLAPYLSERFGRRGALAIGDAVMLIGVILQTASQNVAMFIICRFFIGVGLAFACLAAPVLITELAFPTHRAPITALYNSSWYLGSILAAWITYGTFSIANTWSWRIPSLIQGFPSLLQILLLFLIIPESPRWLVDRGRFEEAHRVLTEYHCNGDDTDPLVELELREIRQAIHIEKEINRTVTYRSLFATKGNRRRMLAIIPYAFFSQWSGNGILSYYLNIALVSSGITSHASENLINGLLQLWNVITAYGGALSVDRLGRRPLWLTSAAGMCVAYTAITIAAALYEKSPVTGLYTQVDPPVTLHARTSAGHAVVAMFFIYYGFYNIAMSPLLVAYTVEILPFNLRAKGLFVMQECVNLSLVFNQYVNPIALPVLRWKYYCIYAAWIAVEFVWLYFTIIETKGPNGPLPLEEIAAIFDGEEAREEIARTQIAPAAQDDKSSGNEMEEKAAV